MDLKKVLELAEKIDSAASAGDIEGTDNLLFECSAQIRQNVSELYQLRNESPQQDSEVNAILESQLRIYGSFREYAKKAIKDAAKNSKGDEKGRYHSAA